MKISKKDLIEKQSYKQIEDLMVENNFACLERDDLYVLLRENLLIKVKKSDKPYKKGDVERLKEAVNEAYGFADTGYYGNAGNGAPYIEYKVIPLNRSLEMKTDKRQESINKNMNNRVIHVGDYVIGKSKYTDKEYQGTIQRIVRDDANDIVTIYVLAKDKGQFVALDPCTVRLHSPIPVIRHSRRFINSGNVITSGIGARVIGGSAS